MASHADADRRLAALSSALEGLRGVLARDDAWLEQIRPPVSAWTPAQHMHHVLRATTLGLDDLLAALDGERPAGGRPTVLGLGMLVTGWLPRGRGVAPKRVTPPRGVTRGDVERELAEAERLLGRVASRRDELPGARGRVQHFMFGRLDALQWVRFLAVHVEHHLKILADLGRGVEDGWSAAAGPDA